jgi:glycine C-acetyltransferase
MFAYSLGAELDEVREFNEWKGAYMRDRIYPFETIRSGPQAPTIDIRRQTGEAFRALNFSGYNYLGLGYHPKVIAAAQAAVARYGLGAASAPNFAGTCEIHVEFEEALVSFFGLPDRGATLFTSGYGANVGTLQALLQKGHHVVLDDRAHMSLLEGARTSGAHIHYFKHNDVDHLATILARLAADETRVVVCVEGVYSADGDPGELAAIVPVVRRHGAYLLVDEAHSTLLCGDRGRGMSEEQGVLEEVDFYIATLSKAFSGVGAALVARRSVTEYVDWYARCRLFSCGLDPAVTGGMLALLELASGPDGDARRRRLHENSAHMRALLSPHVDIGPSRSWIIPVIYGAEGRTFEVADHLQRRGLDSSAMQFPAVPKNQARMRLFMNSEHTREEIEHAGGLILEAADRFGFRRER